MAETRKTTDADNDAMPVDEDFEARIFAQAAGISLAQAKTLIKRHGTDKDELHRMAESLQRAG